MRFTTLPPLLSVIGLLASRPGQLSAQSPEEEEKLITGYPGVPHGAPEPKKGAKGGAGIGGYLYTEYRRDQQKAKNFYLHYLAFTVSGWAGDRIQCFASSPTPKVALKAEYIFFAEGARQEEIDNNLFGLQAALRF